MTEQQPVVLMRWQRASLLSSGIAALGTGAGRTPIGMPFGLRKLWK